MQKRKYVANESFAVRKLVEVAIVNHDREMTEEDARRMSSSEAIDRWVAGEKVASSSGVRRLRETMAMSWSRARTAIRRATTTLAYWQSHAHELTRTHPAYKDIPVIIISTEGKEEDTIRGLKMGARGYVKKPFQASELHSLIEKITGP